MIVDCFLFRDELEMLDFRLAELDNVVDYHVLVEASKTFPGMKKELVFGSHKQRYAAYASKIVHIPVHDMPKTLNNIEHLDRSRLSWRSNSEYLVRVYHCARHQRRSIDRGIKLLELCDDDLIVIADCDEVPDPKMLEHYKNEPLGSGVFTLEQDHYLYNLTCKRQDKWTYAKLLNYRTYKSLECDCERVRMGEQVPIIHRGGWHFSWFGGIDAIIARVQSGLKQNYHKPEYLDRKEILSCIEQPRYLFPDRPGRVFTKVPTKDNPYLPNHYKMLMI